MAGFIDRLSPSHQVIAISTRGHGKSEIGAGEMKRSGSTFHLTRETVFALDPPFWEQQLRLMPEPDRVEEFFVKLSALYNGLTASKELFRSIQCPVLLISGERDQNAHLTTIVAAYHMIPDCQLAIIPMATHAVFLENFAAVWACLLPFLSNDTVR